MLALAVAVVFRFARAHLVPYIPWYVAGIVMLALTNWIAVTIPVVVAQAVDALRAGDAGGGVQQAAVRIGLLGLAVIATRTLSRVAFFTPGRLVEARIKKHLFSQLMRQQPAFHASWPAGDLVSRASSDLNFVRLLSGFGALQICNATMAISLVAIQMVNLSPRLAMWVLVPVAVAVHELVPVVIIQKTSLSTLLVRDIKAC